MKSLLMALTLAVALSGCTNDVEPVTPTQDENGRYVIDMTAALTYNPSMFQVPAGATVVFVNTGSIWHDVTPDGHTAWSYSGKIDGGEEWEMTAPAEPGEYKFFCSPHAGSGMNGVLVVV